MRTQLQTSSNYWSLRQEAYRIVGPDWESGCLFGCRQCSEFSSSSGGIEVCIAVGSHYADHR